MNLKTIFTLLFLVGTSATAMEQQESAEPVTKKGKTESVKQAQVNYQEFEIAVREGNEEFVSSTLKTLESHPELVESFFPDLSQGENPQTALHIAAQNFRYRVVEILLSSPFSDRFYVNPGEIRLPTGLFVGALHSTGIAYRGVMRHLIARFKPQFSQIDQDIDVNEQPLVNALLNCDVAAFRQQLVAGTAINVPAVSLIRNLLKAFATVSTGYTLRRFYRNFNIFLSKLPELENEIVNSEAFTTAMREHFVREHQRLAALLVFPGFALPGQPRAAPINHAHMTAVLRDRREAALQVVRIMPTIFDDFVTNSRLDFIRAFCGNNAGEVVEAVYDRRSLKH